MPWKETCRRPHFNPHQLEGAVVELIIEARKRWPHWGPRKLRVKLQELRPDVVLPAASTIGAVLKRSGLVRHRKRRRRTPPYTMPFGQCVAPNQVWCIDFKGHFKYGNGETCYPLTLTDAFSRYLLRCEIVGNARHLGSAAGARVRVPRVRAAGGDPQR